jgi:hypothetical protein
MPAARSALSLALALTLIGPLCPSARGDGERPLGNLLRDARAAGTLEKLAGTSYYEGGKGRTALVEHTLVVDETGLTSVFVEHFSSGGASRTSYRLNTVGLFESLEIEKASPEGYPSYETSARGKREHQELVIEKPAKRTPLPDDATPMPVMMFLLPQLLAHLPETLELTPLYAKKLLPSGFTIQRHAAEGDEVPVEILTPDRSSVMKVYVSAAEKTFGQLLRIEARREKIRPLSAKEAKAQLAALRSKTKATKASPGFESPRAAVEALIAACAKGDLAAAGACFSAQAPGEFQSLRDGTVPAKSFKQLCQLFEGATLGKIETKGDRAEVAVALASRAERLTVIREGGRWRILDF